MRTQAGRLVLMLVAALAARTAWAIPSLAAAEFRAVICCTRHCGRLPSPSDASRCCGVSTEAGDPAARAAAPDVRRPILVAAVLSPAWPAWNVGPAPAPAVTSVAPPGDPPPFLRLRTLLL